MNEALLLGGCALAGSLLTGLVRALALRSGMLDVPNARSSHVRPTPRGGGLAIVIVVAAVLLGGGALVALPVMTRVTLALAMLAVAAIGWLDDRGGVPARVRFLVHIAAAIGFTAAVGPLDAIRLGSISVPLAWLAWPCTVFWLVAMINLYNFMDGIDGLAGIEAVMVGAIGGLLSMTPATRGVGIVLLATAASSSGFLVWNWAPARIFLGDVGSGAIGFLLGALALLVDRSGGMPLPVWGMLLGVFIVDATGTLARRMMRGEVWYAAHRRHAYQRAAVMLASHARVCTGVIVLNSVLGALAYLAITHSALAPVALLVALAVLLMAYLAVERRAPMFPHATEAETVPS